jgi:alpha-tubulin suppressor-like RCC1 family protein
MWGSGTGKGGQLGQGALKSKQEGTILLPTVPPQYYPIYTNYYLGPAAVTRFIKLNDKKWIDVSAGVSFVAAIDEDGALWAWGDNSAGQLGSGNMGPKTRKFSPYKISDGPFISVCAAGSSLLAIDATHRLWGVGEDARGQLGLGNPQSLEAYVLTLTQVGTAEWSKVACGGDHTLLLDMSGYLFRMGDNTYGQLGYPGIHGKTLYSDYLAPAKLDSIGQCIDIAAGPGFSLAIKSDHTLWAAGRSDHGQTGLGHTGTIPAPIEVEPGVFDPPDPPVGMVDTFTQVGTMNTFTKVAVGGFDALALTAY